MPGVPSLPFLRFLALCAAPALGAACTGARENAVVDGGDGDMTFVMAPHRQPPAVAWQGDGGEDDAKYGPTVLKNFRLVSIAAGNDDLGARLLDFGDGVGKSAWYQALSTEYGLGPASPAVRITGADLKDPKVDDTGIERYIDAALAAQDPPIVPDGKTVIVLYLPGGVQFLYHGIANECDQIAKDDKTFGAYHKAYGALGDQFTVVMRCPLPKGLAQLDQLTLFATQQIADALTNPGDQGYSVRRLPGKVVSDGSAFIENTASGYAEVGDLCSPETRFIEGVSTYHRFYSNKGAKSGGDPCAPMSPVPYYSVTTELDWYGGSPGDTLNIPLTGWSTASIPDWPIRALNGPSGDLINYATARVESTTNVTIAGVTYQTINNGRDATLKLTIPPKAKSGWWNLVHIRSFHVDDSGLTPPTEDLAHRWTIGTFVP